MGNRSPLVLGAGDLQKPSQNHVKIGCLEVPRAGSCATWTLLSVHLWIVRSGEQHTCSHRLDGRDTALVISTSSETLTPTEMVSVTILLAAGYSLVGLDQYSGDLTHVDLHHQPN